MGKRLQILGQDFLKYSYSHSIEGQKVNESKIAQGDGRRCWGWAGTGDNRIEADESILWHLYNLCDNDPIISSSKYETCQLKRRITFSLFLFIISCHCIKLFRLNFILPNICTNWTGSVCLYSAATFLQGFIVSWATDFLRSRWDNWRCDVLLSGVCSYPSHHNQWSCW